MNETPSSVPSGPDEPGRAESLMAREVRALHRLVQIALRAESMEALCGGALDAVAGAIQVDRASILLADETGSMRFKAWVGLSAAYRKAVEGHSPWRLDDPDPAPIVVNEADTDPAIRPFRESLVREGIGSLAFVPLVTQRRLIGKFMLYSAQPGRFGPAEMRLASTLAGTVALAIVRMKQEEALQERGVRLDALFKALPVMIYEAETGSPFSATWLSPNVMALTGFEAGRFLHQRHFWEGRLHPEERQAVVAAFREARLGIPIELEYRWQVADGSYHWFLERSEPMEALPDGRLRIVGIWFDITDRQYAAEALRQSEASYRDLFECVREAIFVMDPGGRILAANRGATVMYGYPREELAGLEATELVAAELADPDALRNGLLQALAGEAGQFESWGRRKGGDAFPEEVRLYPGTYFGREVAIALAQDITSRRRQEEALRQTQKLESLGLLAGGIAHDFNNLLTALLGNLNLAQLRLPKAAPASPFLADMESIILRASELTKQMLAYSGKGHFVVKPQDLNALVREMARLLEASLPKLIRIELQLEPSARSIQADASQLQQVVMNLVTNAADAIGSAPGLIRIATREVELDAAAIAADFPGQTLSPGTYLALVVADSGCGMPAEVMHRIFDPFFTTKAIGRGLGLSAMQGILRGHQAGITIHSQPGRGSTFTVFFPALEVGAAAAPSLPPEPPSEFSGRVLLVDDEQIILESTGSALQAMGFEVVLARDGVEALEKFLAGGAWDLVLMDVSMPRMDGPTAFLAMQRERPGVPVIFSSGFDRSERPDFFGAQGRAGFLQKPYRLQDLAASIREVLPVRQDP